MKKLCSSFLLTALLGLHLSSVDVLAQTCTQLSLPENAIARLCRQEGDVVIDLDYSPDGKTLAGLMYRQIVLWDVENKTEKLTIDVNGQTVRYSPDGKTLVCGNTVYDATTGEPTLLLLDGEGYRDYVLFSPDGKTLAGAGPKGIRFWNATIEKSSEDALPVGDTPIDVLPTDTPTVGTPEETSPTSTPIATSSTTVPGIRGLSYSPDGKELVLACGLGIWIYDVESNSEIALLSREMGGHTGPVYSVAYSLDGNTIASGGSYADAKKICIWDARSKELKFSLSNPKIPGGSFRSVVSLAFSPDNKMLVSGDSRVGDQIHFWDASTGEYRYTLRGHQNSVRSVIFSSNGKFLASCSNDRTILVWDLASYPSVSISPDSVSSSTVGEELAFDVNMTNGKNLSGYQATVEFDPEALEYIETKYSDYLSDGVPVQPIANQRSGTVQLASLSLSGVGSDGDGTLATIKFKVKAIRTSKIGLRDVILSDPEGKKSYAWIDGAQLLKSVTNEDGETITCSTNISEDVNKDCVVNIQDLVLVATNFGKGGGIAADVNSDGRVDIIDLVLVAGVFGDTAGAPTLYADTQDMLSAFNVQKWLQEAQKVNITDPTFQRGIVNLQNLLSSLMPEQTMLLANYPNPFNPETWIPYQLAEQAEVSISIYAADGVLVRTLALGNQAAGLYQNRNRAAYWDGKNKSGEAVASGVYFYTLTAGDFSATRKMIIRK